MRLFDILASILTWGGLRGGISVALVLSLPKGEIGDILLTVTYIVVVFWVLVRGSPSGLWSARLPLAPTATPAQQTAAPWAEYPTAATAGQRVMSPATPFHEDCTLLSVLF